MRRLTLQIKRHCSTLVWGVLLQCALLIPCVSGQELTWVTVEGTAPMEHAGKEEARNRAIEDAMDKAVAEVVGAAVSSEVLMVTFRLSGGIVGAIPYGKVVEKEIMEESVVNIHHKEHDTPSVLYRVKMKAGVAEETTGADSSFRLDASLNRSTFKDGDEMLIRIKSTKDCYIAVFTILEDEKIVRLLPNRFKEDNFIKADETFSFPDEHDKKKGIRLKAHTPGNKDAVTEAFYIVALKRPFTFDAGFQEGIYGIYNGQTALMNDLVKEMVSIPLSDRAEALMQYQIRKNNGGVK